MEVVTLKFSPVVPFEPISTEVPPTGDHWISQVKWDGVRILVYYDGHNVSLMNRRLNNRTLQFPELTDIQKFCSAESVILDGEVIALENGSPSFHKVMRRDGIRKLSSVPAAKLQVPITYMIFDILYFNGEWVTNKSLQERQVLLESIIEENDYIQLVKNQQDSNSLYKAVVEHELEGIIIKDLTSKYAINGKDKRWQKKKVIKDLNAVIGGVTYRSGIVNALLLGLYDENGQLWYIGHAGTGKLSQKDWRSLTETIQGMIVKERPFINNPSRYKEATWIKPELSAKINFLEWTQSKTLRQPSIQSLVTVDIKECTFDSQA
jgi:bifunctional non-homologous end joining protein LigD